MIAEQTVTCRYKADGLQDAIIEIQMTVQIERRAEERFEGSVEIIHVYSNPDQLTDEEWEIWDKYFQRLNNGVHGGYALSDVPYLPNTMLSVKILELHMSPDPASTIGEKFRANLGYLLEVTIGGIVETLLRSLENLRSGEETYLEWKTEPQPDDEDAEADGSA